MRAIKQLPLIDNGQPNQPIAITLIGAHTQIQLNENLAQTEVGRLERFFASSRPRVTIVAGGFFSVKVHSPEERERIELEEEEKPLPTFTGQNRI